MLDLPYESIFLPTTLQAFILLPTPWTLRLYFCLCFTCLFPDISITTLLFLQCFHLRATKNIHHTKSLAFPQGLIFPWMLAFGISLSVSLLKYFTGFSSSSLLFMVLGSDFPSLIFWRGYSIFPHSNSEVS